MYKYVLNAGIERNDVIVHFDREYEDASDIYCDSVRPDWVGTENFDITIIKIKSWDEVKKGEGWEISCKHRREIERIKFHVNSKLIANYIWWLAKEQNASYEVLKEMYQNKKFA